MSAFNETKIEIKFVWPSLFSLLNRSVLSCSVNKLVCSTTIHCFDELWALLKRKICNSKYFHANIVCLVSVTPRAEFNTASVVVLRAATELRSQHGEASFVYENTRR